MYETRARATGGRAEGSIKSDGEIEMRLRLPKELGGAIFEGEMTETITTNPEQLFACAWAASLADALGFVARQHNRILREIAVTAIVRLGQYEADGFGTTAEFEIELPELSKAEAAQFVAQAEQTCPYSKVWQQTGEILKATIL